LADRTALLPTVSRPTASRSAVARTVLRVAFAAAAALAAAPVVPLWAHDVPGDPSSVRPAKPATMEPVAAEMADAALAFWASLTPDQQKKAAYAFDSEERRTWFFIPKARNGLPYKEMTPAQRNLAWAFLSTGLSHHGFTKAQQIMSLEDVLKAIEPGPPKTPARDAEMYYFTVFGTPDAKGTWGWRVEGHHLSINFTIAGGKAVTAAPTFMGDNPGEVREGPRKGFRVLAIEEDLGRRLVKSLDEAQQKKAIVSKEAPKDVISLNARKVDYAKVAADLPGTGIAVSDLKPEQREQLLTLIETYARRHRAEIADQEVRKIHVAGFDKVTFVWAGGTEPREPHYYKIQGPTFMVEYDNTQNNANHIHTVWRDPANDFGEDMLKQHYESDPEHMLKK
jgi:hypothetical protein